MYIGMFTIRKWHSMMYSGMFTITVYLRVLVDLMYKSNSILS